MLLASAVFICGWGASTAHARRSRKGLAGWMALAIFLCLVIGLISMSVMYHWAVTDLFDTSTCPWWR